MAVQWWIGAVFGTERLSDPSTLHGCVVTVGLLVNGASHSLPVTVMWGQKSIHCD